MMLYPQASAESVRDHLRGLGYDDVPDDVLQELADELNEQSTSNVVSSDAAVQQPTVPIAPKTKHAVSRDDVISQLQSLGYDQESVPADILDELVQELNEALSMSSSPQRPSEPPVVKSAPVNNISRPQSPVRHRHFIPSPVAAPSATDERSSSPSPTRNRHDEEQDSATERSSTTDHIHNDHLDFTDIRRQVQQQRLQHALQLEIAQEEQEQAEEQRYRRLRQQQRSRSIMSQPLQQPRKQDPVSLYHRFKQQWDNDAFLQRLTNPAASKSKERMFGGLGYHALMGGNKVQVRRRMAKEQPPPPWSTTARFEDY